MFRYVKLKNYKSLIDFYADLTTKRGAPQKMMLIYGENGVGKSNFASSFFTLCETTRTKAMKDKVEQIMENFKDVFKDESIKDEFFKEDKVNFLGDFFYDTKDIIKNCKTNDSTGNMLLEFGFRLKGYNGMYSLETDNTKIVSEHLEYVWNKNQTTFFDITENSIKINKNIFKEKEYEYELEELISKYWGKHSLLSLISYEMEDKNDGYLNSKLCKGLLDTLNFFNNLSIKLKASYKVEKGELGITHPIFGKLQEGRINISGEKELDKAEEFLNSIFTSLYSDIKQVYYKRSVSKDKIKYQLFLKKIMFNKIVEVDFNQESTGTQYLLQILPYLVTGLEGNTVIIDEMDTGIHDLLIESLLENLFESINGQFIITTHNTMLLEAEFSSKSVYIFDVDKEGKKTLLPLTSFEDRIHPNLNIRKRYLKGLYGGVPISMDVDFKELTAKLK